MVTELRLEAAGRGGSAVLLSAPAGLLRDVGRWGPVGDAIPLMRAVKQQFDPQNTLNPGVGAWAS
jgi:glycolate oxidase FAD binding subunit